MKPGSQHVPYLMAAITGLVLSFLSHAADNVAINFTGTIRAAACSVASGADQTVLLGDTGTTYFGNPGDVSPAKPFSIVLDCPAGGPDQATVTFSGLPASDPDLLALDTGGAAGVAVRINDSDGSQIKLGTPSAVTTLVVGSNSLAYQAQYQSLVDRVGITAGAANATAQFTINYP